MSGLTRPISEPTIDRNALQQGILDLFQASLRGAVGGDPTFSSGALGIRQGEAPGIPALLDIFSFPGQFAAGPTDIQRRAVGAGEAALTEVLPGVRELARTGGAPDIEGVFDIGRAAEQRRIEEEAEALRESFGLRGTRLSRGRGIAEGNLRERALETGQARREALALEATQRALDRRLAASQAAFALPSQAFGLGEGLRSISDVEIMRRMAEFGNVRSMLLSALTGEAPVVTPNPIPGLIGAGSNLAGAAKLSPGAAAA